MNKEQDNIINSITNPHGILLLSPRLGKTRIGIELIKKFKFKSILWVTPNTKLRDKDIPEEFVKWKAKSFLKKTTIICYPSLINLKGSFDLIIFDELQDITSTNIEPLFNGNVTYSKILGLTGTLPKHKDKLDIYKLLKLKVLVEVGIEEAIDSDLIADYQINCIELHLDNVNKNIEAGNSQKRFYQTEVQKYDYLSKQINTWLYTTNEKTKRFFLLQRMRFINSCKSKNDYAKKLLEKLPGRTLIFTGGIEQAESICENTYHSKTTDEKLNQFIDGKIDKLACVNAGGVGFTYRNVDNILITQVNSNKKGQIVQKIARGLVKQEGYKANIYILYLKNTVDENWLNSSLEDFNTDKVKYLHKNFINELF